MENCELFGLLDIPEEVIDRLNEYGERRKGALPQDLCRKLLSRGEWEQGVKDLQAILAEDTDGIHILWEQLNIVCGYSYDEYVRRGIGIDVFVDTMKFCTRFLREHYAQYGVYKYVWAWWFPRQISLSEFRIGALEYEFADGEDREIAVHIPSDADMDKQSVQESLRDFCVFRDTFFPGWQGVRLTCDSWMLMPQLRGFLGKDSHIVAFQDLFEIDSVDGDATWYMGWIYPGYEKIDDSLPERTVLQRELKKYLLAGNRFGIAKGHIVRLPGK
ncbi:MAG: acyltransferase domain-containing protein [Acetatifactor sp.]